MAKILVLNGPNLNLLGQREPHIYGHLSLAQIEEALHLQAAEYGHEVICCQSNAEYKLVEWVQNAPRDQIDFIIVNAAALTHSSIALRDAFLAVQIPFIEVHLSNIFAREPFRHHSYLSDIARGVIVGFGRYSYEMALEMAIKSVEAA